MAHLICESTQLLRVRHFATIGERRLALAEFAAFHDANRLRERRGCKTPDRLRAAQAELETEAATEFRSAA